MNDKFELVERIVSKRSANRKHCVRIVAMILKLSETDRKGQNGEKFKILSCAMCQVSGARCQLSIVMCHLSPVICHLSTVTNANSHLSSPR